MPQTYLFQRTPELAGLRVQVESRGRELFFETTGPGAETFGPVVQAFFSFLNQIGPLTTLEGESVYSLYYPPIPSPAHARLLEAFIRTLFLQRPTPMAVTVAVTDQCQCRCRHCSAPKPDPSRKIMTGEEIGRVIQESQALGVSNITFTGGEPLLRDDLERFISSVDREKAMAQVFTNGLDLTARRARSLKEAGASAVQISLDSPVPEEHERLRGRPGLFEKVRQAVGHAREAGLLVGLSTYAGRDSAGRARLSRLAALAAEWGAVELSVFDLIPTGRLLESESLALDGPSRARLLRESERLNLKYQGRLRVITQTWTNSGVGYAAFIGCLAACHQFHVGAYGDLTPCDFTPLSLGNIRQASLSALWERLTTHPQYCRRQAGCRMQDPAFRARYIRPLSGETRLPWPIQDLDQEG